jgi:hypothetical protein
VTAALPFPLVAIRNMLMATAWFAFIAAKSSSSRKMQTERHRRDVKITCDDILGDTATRQPLQEPRASKEMDDGEDSGCEAIRSSRTRLGPRALPIFLMIAGFRMPGCISNAMALPLFKSLHFRH